MSVSGLDPQEFDLTDLRLACYLPFHYKSESEKKKLQISICNRSVRTVTLVDVSEIFFFCSGRGKGESEAPGGAGWVSIENPRRRGGGGGPRRGRGRGAGRVSAANWAIWGVAVYFVFGAETSTKSLSITKKHPTQKLWTRRGAVSTQGSRQVIEFKAFCENRERLLSGTAQTQPQP